MVHLAVGMVVLALTCVVLTLVTYVSDLDVSTTFAIGSFVALGTTGAFLAYVVRRGM